MLLLAVSEAIAGQITLAWDPSEDTVAGYTIYYGTQSGSYSGQVDVGNQTSATVPGLTSGVRYYFAVKAYSSSGLFSAASNEVSGIAASLPFTDDPLLPGIHTMKAVHITELRNRIDALRSARGLSTWPWPSVAAGTLIRASDIAELRQALGEVFAARGLSAPTYLDGPTLAAGTSIKALHITQLRSAVTSLE
jgi:hypothetical protein